MKIFRGLKSYSLITYIFLVFSLFLIGEVGATTYYVCDTGSTCGSGWSTGNDSNNGTSKSTPFKTIQKAANIVNPGDTVIVGNGTYDHVADYGGHPTVLYINRSGTSNNWITFKAENTWGAKIDGQNEVQFCVQFHYRGPAAYIRLEGFEITNCCDTNRTPPAGDAVFINAENQRDCNKSHAHDIYLYKLLLHDTCPIETNNNTGMAAIDMDRCTGPITIDSCTFYNIGRLNPYTTPTAPQSSCTGASVYCYNHDAAVYNRCSDVTVINNIFYPNHVSGWPMQPYAIYGKINNMKIVNNTFYGSNPQRNYHIVLAGSDGFSNILIQNNIFHSPRNYALNTASSASNMTVKNNLVYGASLIDGRGCSNSAYTCSGNISGQNPQFVDLDRRDFHLLSNSPAIDKGLGFAGRTKDFDGNAIVGLPDIGAYEYGGSQALPPPSGDVTQPAPPVITEIK